MSPKKMTPGHPILRPDHYKRIVFQRFLEFHIFYTQKNPNYTQQFIFEFVVNYSTLQNFLYEKSNEIKF